MNSFQPNFQGLVSLNCLTFTLKTSFLLLGQFDKPLSERLGNVGDLSDRKELREKMQCKSFKWFLDTIVAGEIFFSYKRFFSFEKYI